MQNRETEEFKIEKETGYLLVVYGACTRTVPVVSPSQSDKEATHGGGRVRTAGGGCPCLLVRTRPARRSALPGLAWTRRRCDRGPALGEAAVEALELDGGTPSGKAPSMKCRADAVATARTSAHSAMPPPDVDPGWPRAPGAGPAAHGAQPAGGLATRRGRGRRRVSDGAASAG